MRNMMNFIFILIVLYIVDWNKLIANRAVKSVKRDIDSNFEEVNQVIEELIREKNMKLLYQDCYEVLIKFLFYMFLVVGGLFQLFYSYYWMNARDISIFVLMLTIAIAVIEAKANYNQKELIERDIKNCWFEIIDETIKLEKRVAMKETRKICEAMYRKTAKIM